MKNNNIKLFSLGGSGENGRNCFVIEHDDQYILLDCGVQRSIINGNVGAYPLLTQAIVAKIKMVFLSHCHEDHVAAVPLLYELGYQGVVYASAETLALVPSFIQKWQKYVINNGGHLPFSQQAIDAIRFAPIQLGKNMIDGLTVITGRTGHVIGSLWFHFNFTDYSVLYTGDIVSKPTLLENDPLPQCNAAIVNCAYAGMDIDQTSQLQDLLRSIKQTVAENGIALLPVPPTGRGADLFHYLKTNLENTTIYVDKSVYGSYLQLLEQHQWLNLTQIQAANNLATIKVIDPKHDDSPLIGRAGVYLIGDGMLSTPDSQRGYERIKQAANNKIIISGHAATGTTAANIFDQHYCQQHNVNCTVEKIIFKVHFDDNDVLQFCDNSQPQQVLLFHAAATKQAPLIERLRKQGIVAKSELNTNLSINCN